MRAPLRIGIHTSRSPSLEKAALRAHELGANTFQIFSASPRMWRTALLSPDDIARFQEARKRFDLQPLAIHVNYLINLASLDSGIRDLSVASFRGELQRAITIGAEYLITHPGNYKSCSTEEGIALFVKGLSQASEGIDLNGLTVLLENTVGAGCQLGGNLEELRVMRDLAKQTTRVRVGFCLDTCHLLAAGFDIASERGLRKSADHIEEVLGWDNVHVIHANDSKGALGSRLDRHANIGGGHIGAAGFRRILRHPSFRSKPFILETPVDEEGDDRRNLDMLKQLSKNARKSVRLPRN